VNPEITVRVAGGRLQVTSNVPDKAAQVALLLDAAKGLAASMQPPAEPGIAVPPPAVQRQLVGRG
jgi:hypothetical protein